MRDLEQELTGALTAVAEDAPGAVGLAGAARRRHRVRRQRRRALGGAAAALVVAFGAVVIGGLGGDDRATDPVDDPAPEGWQTISHEDVRVSVPGDWTSVDCPEGPSRYAPPGAEPCSGDVGVWIDGSATYDPFVGPGVLFAPGDLPSGNAAFGGHVSAGLWVVAAGADSEELVRRVLSTVRLDGQPLVDAGTWVTFDRGALSYELPAWWGVGEDADRSGYSVCATLAKGQESLPPEQVDASHVVLREVHGDRMVTVAAPTRALAELVMATVEVDERTRSDAPCAPEDFTTGLLPGESSPGAGAADGSGVLALAEVEHDGVTVSVLDNWREKRCGGLVQYTPGVACQDVRQGEGIQFLDATSFEPAMDEGTLLQDDSGAAGLWAGYVRRGAYAVLVVHPDREVAQVLLDQVR